MKTRLSSFRFLGASVLVALGAATLPAHDADAVGTRHFVLEQGDDFESGELEGASVDSLGSLRAGFELGALEVPEADSVWSTYREGDKLFLGTGNEGKLLLVESGKVKEVARAQALALTCITRAFGQLIVGAMPGGKLYELDGDSLKVFAELKGGEHIWAMSFDEKEGALYVATGPEGKLFRVTQDGTAQVYFDATEEHLVSVLSLGKEVLVGTGDEARLHAVTGPGRSTVLHDFSGTEVRALVAADDALYVVVNELEGAGSRGKVDKTKPGTPTRGGSKGGSGRLYVFRDGSPEMLYKDKDEQLVSLTLESATSAVVGTGKEGRVVRVHPDHRFEVLADVEERQVVGLNLGESGGVLVSNDPVVVHPLLSVGSSAGVWTSEALDAGIRARFGRMTWRGEGRFVVETRSGNTEEPGDSWSDWSGVASSGASVASPSARYLQVRVRMKGSDAMVTRLDVPYLTDNLRPVITRVEAKSSASTSGSTGVETSGAPKEGSASAKVRLSWEVDNPDKDELRYFVEAAPEGAPSFHDVLEPGTVLTKNSWDWDTSELPEGRYQVRVTASDELSNPPDRVKRHQRMSDVVLVDNTAPRLLGLRLAGQKLVGKASDGVGPIARLEVKGAEQRVWVPFEPSDGLFDQAEEAFSLDFSSLGYLPGTLITVRVFDIAGNSDVAHVRVP